MIDFSVTKCDVSDTVLEIIRFLSHITLLHIISSALNNDAENTLFNTTFLKTLLYTCIAILLYQIIVKKIFYSTIKKMKSVCTEDIKTKEDDIIEKVYNE
jgi:hypothetical protein